MRRMFNDLLIFVLLWVLLIVGYGVAVETLLFPVREFDSYSVIDVVYR